MKGHEPPLSQEADGQMCCQPLFIVSNLGVVSSAKHGAFGKGCWETLKQLCRWAWRCSCCRCLCSGVCVCVCVFVPVNPIVTSDFHFLLQDARTLELIFKPQESAPPKWGWDRWGCEHFQFNLFFGDVLWKVCAQERYVGSLISEKKSSSTMKEGHGEMVEPGLSDNCLQISESKFFQFLALRLCPDSKRVTNARVVRRRLFLVSRQLSQFRGVRQFVWNHLESVSCHFCGQGEVMWEEPSNSAAEQLRPLSTNAQ